MKIAVYAISKNESQFVERFCKSAVDADLIVIADTGSTDNTVELAKEHGAVVYDICISPWRFDKARDACLSLLPRDVDICISLDLDEVLEPGWRQEIERVWRDETTRMRYKFDWGSGISFYAEKIHSRHGYHWHHPCHESLRPDPRLTEIWSHSDMLLVTHHPDPTKSRSQYLDLLKVAVKEDKDCPRNAFYYARELTFYGHHREGIEALNRYLALPDAVWTTERCYAMRLLGKCYEELGDERAAKWYRLAVAECPETREPWMDLAMYAYRKSLWAECYGAAISALNITDKQINYTMDPIVWTERPYDLASIAAYRLGFKDQAIEFCKKALEFAPTDNRLLSNLELMNE